MYIDAKWSFWDCDYGCAGSIHDYVFFQKLDVKSHMMKEKFLHYKLIKDATYPMWGENTLSPPKIISQV
jgi:hypothetical protein